MSTELKADSDNVVKAKLKISPQCRLGIHAVRLRSATGISNLRTFTVGPLPEVPEQEPNNDFAAPQAVPFGCTVSGVVQNEDVDHFVVEAKQGERITAELEGIRLGYTFFDPYLAILNSDRFELARSDDAALLRQDCLCAVVAPADGKYIVQVRESAYGGNGSCLYRLHVGKFPRPTAVLPAGGRPSEALTVRWLGDPAGEWTEQVTLPSTEDLAYGLFAKDAIGISPSPNVVRVTDLPNAIEAEPNDTTAQASAGTAPGALNGIIEKPGDVDFFKFSAKQGQQFDIRVLARVPLRSPLDPVLVILRANGAGLASNDDSGGPDAYLRFNAPADEDYFIQVYDHLRAGGPDIRVSRRDHARQADADDDAARGATVRARGAARAARQPHGLDDQRGPQQLGRRLERDAGRSAAGPDLPDGADGRGPHDGSGAVHRHRGCAVGRHADPGDRPAGRRQLADRRPIGAADHAGSRAEQHRRLGPHGRPDGCRRDRRRALRDRDRPAPGPDRSPGLQATEGGRQTQGGLRPTDRRAFAVRSAGHRGVRLDLHPRRQERGGDPADRQRQCRHRDLAADRDRNRNGGQRRRRSRQPDGPAHDFRLSTSTLRSTRRRAS